MSKKHLHNQAAIPLAPAVFKVSRFHILLNYFLFYFSKRFFLIIFLGKYLCLVWFVSYFSNIESANNYQDNDKYI